MKRFTGTTVRDARLRILGREMPPKKIDPPVEVTCDETRSDETTDGAGRA